MFDSHLSRLHRLRYFVRGPEWAFAIPEGDLAALEDVMRRCSGFWNGAGSLLIPVRRDGRLPKLLDALQATRGIDQCFIHETVETRARDAVQHRLPNATLLWDGFDEHELHPLHLLGTSRDTDAAKPHAEFPQFRAAGLQRVVLALWGHVPEEDMELWRERFEVQTARDDEAHGALLRGQVPGVGHSPLQAAAVGMGLVEQRSPLWWHPYLWVIEGATFRELTAFWNFRARSLWHGPRPAVVGIPRESLRRPDQLRALADWTPRISGLRRVPDTFVACTSRAGADVRAALAEVPFVEETETNWRELSGRDVLPNEPRTFAFRRPTLGGPFVRGTGANALVSFDDGTASLSLTAPEDFRVRNFAHARLVFGNLPLPLPVTTSAARAVNINAHATDGVLLVTSAMGSWDFDVRLPTAAEALRYWASDHGYALASTQGGRDAEALLGRLGSLDALDSIADGRRLALLRTLAPASRVRLTRRLIAEAQEAGIDLDEAAMAQRLADIGLFLEVEARTAADIAGAMGTGTRKRDVLRLLPALVGAGFIRRAHEVRCPRCRFRMLLDLADQDEQVRCRACREMFVLPVVDESGSKEPELFYRLDGLMARAMDQDVLPVLLTLRALRPPHQSPDLFFAWPGIEFADDQGRVDVDLLVSNGTAVSCFEVKNNASGLKEPQLRKLLRVAERLGARPGIAAVEGTFAPELSEQVLEAGGRLLTTDDLLT